MTKLKRLEQIGAIFSMILICGFLPISCLWALSNAREYFADPTNNQFDIGDNATIKLSGDNGMILNKEYHKNKKTFYCLQCIS